MHILLYVPTFRILNLIQQSLIRQSANIIKLDLFLNNAKTSLNSEMQEKLSQREDWSYASSDCRALKARRILNIGSGYKLI